MEPRQTVLAMGQPQLREAGALPIPGRELTRWPLLAWLLPLIPLTVLLGASLQPERRMGLLLQPGLPVSSEPFRLEPGPWGAPLLDLQLALPPNSSAVLDVDVLDAAQQPRLQLSKEAWREVTSWVEQGESGVEDVGDTEVRLDLRPQQGGDHRLRVELQELLDAAGRPVNQPLTARLRVRNHVVDAPLLLLTTAVSSLLVALGLHAYSEQGRQRQRCRRDDRHLDCRLVIGGEGLVRLSVRGRYEGGDDRRELQATPELELLVCDSQGRRIMRRRLPLRVHRRSQDSLRWWIVEARLHLRFEESESRRLRVVVPQQLGDSRARLEWAEMTVLDGCRVLLPHPVLQGLSPSS